MAQAMGDYLEFLKEQVGDYQGEYQEIIVTVPTYFALLTGVLDDSRFPAELRSVVNSALAYFISLSTLETMRRWGRKDTWTTSTCAPKPFWKLKEKMEDHQVILDHWDGEEDPFKLSQSIIEALNEELGEDSIQLIRQYTGLDIV